MKESLGSNMIASLTAQEFDLFLGSLKVGDTAKHVSPRTRDNFRNSIVTLLGWAKRKRYLPGDFDEQDRIDRRGSDEDGVIEIYTPKEMEALLLPSWWAAWKTTSMPSWAFRPAWPSATP